jgi:SpoIID/LytB domain protein
VLTQVLNDYDQETNDFFRWKVVYSQAELSELIKTRSGINFGTIVDLIPLVRGGSGRIIKLKIIGTLQTMTIGKELEIRKSLSKSHLYSSAFVVDKKEVDGEIIFILNGAGWGHGVGLCQIGAAVMGDKGYGYQEILYHYFRGANLERMYE